MEFTSFYCFRQSSAFGSRYCRCYQSRKDGIAINISPFWSATAGKGTCSLITHFWFVFLPPISPGTFLSSSLLFSSLLFSYSSPNQIHHDDREYPSCHFFTGKSPFPNCALDHLINLLAFALMRLVHSFTATDIQSQQSCNVTFIRRWHHHHLPHSSSTTISHLTA
jgi:hypothetical protein